MYGVNTYVYRFTCLDGSYTVHKDIIHPKRRNGSPQNVGVGTTKTPSEWQCPVQFPGISQKSSYRFKRASSGILECMKLNEDDGIFRHGAY